MDYWWLLLIIPVLFFWFSITGIKIVEKELDGYEPEKEN